LEERDHVELEKCAPILKKLKRRPQIFSWVLELPFLLVIFSAFFRQKVSNIGNKSIIYYIDLKAVDYLVKYVGDSKFLEKNIKQIVQGEKLQQRKYNMFTKVSSSCTFLTMGNYLVK
jgi:hypothetical protein